MNILKLNFKQLLILIINLGLIFLISCNSIQALKDNDDDLKFEKKEKELILPTEIPTFSTLEKQILILKKEIEKNEIKLSRLTELKKEQENEVLILKKRREGNFFHRTLYFFKGLYKFMEEDWKSSFFGISTIIIIFLIIMFILS